MRLSKNFVLEEFLRSQTATRFDIDMTPNDEVIANLSILVTTCLQPLRDALGVPINVSSGYRPQVLNALIRGSRTSAHMNGRAVDFSCPGLEPLHIAKTARALKLPYDQLIVEFGRWVHLGIAKDPRGEELTAYRENRKTKYAVGLVGMVA